ncbi:Chitin synthase 2 [Operophtera brumata]|uniref:chitin synthase n=1 Tax=Operophtera brumata TaxID=104452 RepID=A0A0L7KX06_OPEBR|nr:Chitin synthase 2 [Operophtera brumata]
MDKSEYSPISCLFPANIFMDDAFELASHNSEDMQANRFVQCLVECIDESASEVHLTNVRLRPPKKYPTPYGGRLVWTLPGKNKLICHLKDKMKIRHRKRWSQEVIAENTYLLALDGDIDFKPEAVTLLVDLMKKDTNLGAACGRIHPMGSGFMAWYQMFEYAIGHWLQKATEHMIGCVLCSPGCFSLFRGKALMDDNVMKKYTLTSSEARHYVQYDQGYRVEYSAASDAYTHCPELFDEFFNQRRRWVPSTMANIFDLLADSKRTVQMNDNISTIYITYQSLLMIGTVLGPGTIFLMMIGAMNAITGISNLNALFLNLLMLAMAITCVYAMVMMVVIVGIALQIVEDGWMAPSSVFFIITFGSFFITAALHPQEIICLMYLFIYYITIPSMYMLLIIYSLCNLNNVTWGTRETVAKKSPKELEMERKEAEEAKKTMDTHSVLKWFGMNKGDETSGSMEFKRDDLVNPYWIEDPNLQKGEVDFLTTAEIEFWKDLIDAYLRPIDEDKAELDRIAHDLKNLRNTMVFAFIMLNALFVVVIFLLQLNQDQLHLKWPLGQKVSLTYDDEFNVPDDMSEDALLEKHAVQIAKDLQRLNTDDLERRDMMSRLPSLGGNTSTRRATLRALKTRRDSGYEPAFDSDDEEPRPRRSTVRFRDHYA